MGGGGTGSFGHKSLINVFARKRAEIQTKISLKKITVKGISQQYTRWWYVKKKKEGEEKK